MRRQILGWVYEYVVTVPRFQPIYSVLGTRFLKVKPLTTSHASQATDTQLVGVDKRTFRKIEGKNPK